MSSARPLRTWVDIDLQALRANLQQVREHNQSAGITAVIKSNAYGHGMEEVARVLTNPGSPLQRFAVATLDEAVALNALGLGRPILLLQGFTDEDQLRYLIEAGIEFVVHADYQLAILKRTVRNLSAHRPLTVWLKLDTGMHRLGLEAGEFRLAFTALQSIPQVGQVVLMSHLASADAPDDEVSMAHTHRQLDCFRSVCDGLDGGDTLKVSRSLAASAGILAWPDTHFDHLRPGIMLYGGSPFGHRNGPRLGLRPVMTLRSRLIAVKQVPAGGSVGYGATYRCDVPTRMGVASIGYGDGYPRSAGNGTPVLVATPEGFRRTRLIGRVSMDMITIDLNGFDNTEVGDEVVLWGEGLSADEVAEFAGTISYELFCQVTRRVPYFYSGSGSE
ncbi:MAG: alanine racemase [Gammaproteobacteria bacterium]|jgi:alanine racemase